MLRQKRWAIFSLWRPVKPVTRENLTLADSRSIPDSSLRPVLARFRRPEATENLNPLTAAAHNRNDVETWSVAPPAEGEEHKWYFCSGMTPEEVLVLKIFDSKEDVARRCPHTAFTCSEDFGGRRESIEVRCLVFWE